MTNVQQAGAQAARQAVKAGNRVSVPSAWNLGLGDFLRRTAVATGRDQVFSHAGNIAFRALFALFPALIALLWLLNVLRAEQLTAQLIELAETAMPEAASGPIREQLSNVPHDQATGAFTVAALLSVIGAVWALASMTRAMMNGLNTIYGVEEGRSFLRSTSVSVLLALAVSILLVAALFLTVFGSALARDLAEAANSSVVLRWAWEIVTWPLLVTLVLATCALVYFFAPDVEQRFRWISAGAIIATVLWVLFTVIYSIYVNRFASYENLYGALAGIIALMAYFYTSSLILLLGAEMNQVIEQTHPEGKDLGERTPADGSAG